MAPNSPRPSLTIQTRPSPLMPSTPNPGLGLSDRLDLPIPSTPPRQRARSSSPPGTRTGTPGGSGSGSGRPVSPGLSGQRYFTPGSTSPRPEHGSPNPGGYEPVGVGSRGVGGIGKAVAGRVLRTVRRGNLPFLIVFVSYVPSLLLRSSFLPTPLCVYIAFQSLDISYLPVRRASKRPRLTI